MLNNLRIGTVAEVQFTPENQLYLVRRNNSSDSTFLVFSDKGLPLEDKTIFTVTPASLFFDTAGNFYCLNGDNRIAQYNFETGELEELAGQTTEWDKILLARLDDGSFMTSVEEFNSSTTNWEIHMQRYDIDGTQLEDVTLTGIDYDVTSVQPVVSFSTDGVDTTLSWNNDVYLGTGTYSGTGILTNFVVEEILPNETGGTLLSGFMYSMASEVVMLIRDLSTGEIVVQIPITDYNVGSIGVVFEEALPAFSGLVTSIDSANPTTSTIANAEGAPVLFTEPGRKLIELTTQQNMDKFLDGQVEGLQVGGETFEIESIFTEGDTYQVTIQTPEIT